jgi:hypothetical protein
MFGPRRHRDCRVLSPRLQRHIFDELIQARESYARLLESLSSDSFGTRP